MISVGAAVDVSHVAVGAPGEDFAAGAVYLHDGTHTAAQARITQATDSSR